MWPTRHALRSCASRMQGLVHKAGVADATRELILAAYHALGADVVVAVRSSATGEDGRDASFAGMNATITNVSGDDELIDAVLRCWMSLFSPRVITYRASRNFTADPAMAVVVQQMVNSEKAGVAFTADPSNGAQDRVVIEGAFGLGEVVVSGEVEPDTYIVSKETLEVLDIRIGHKAFKIVRGPDGHDKVVDLDDAQADARVLDDAELQTHRRTRHRDRAAQRLPAGHGMGDLRRHRRIWCRPGRSRRCAIRRRRHQRSTRCWPADWPRRPGSRLARCVCSKPRTRAAGEENHCAAFARSCCWSSTTPR